MDPRSQRQYDKIFKSGEILATNNISSQSLQVPFDRPQSVHSVIPDRTQSVIPDRTHAAIAEVLLKVNQLKLDDEEFDDPKINLDSLENYSKETIYDILMMKFTRMVQIVREDESEIQKLIQTNQTLKDQLAELIRTSDQVLGKAQEEIKQLIESNAKINTDATLGKADTEKLQALLCSREEEVHKLKATHAQLIDEFVLLRQKQQEVEAKSSGLKTTVAELRNSLEEWQKNVSESELLLDERQKELEDLKKQRKVLEAGIKQNQQQLNTIVAAFKKKSSGYEDSLNEYRRTLAKNSKLAKKLEELEKEKQAVSDEISQKNNELAHVRALNEDYEYKAGKYQNLEMYYRIAQDRYYKLMTEAELIKEQINELAPHSFLDVSPKQSVEYQSFTTAEKGGKLQTSEEERLANLSPEEIEKEIQLQKQQIKVNQLKIDHYEEKNTEEIDKINAQRDMIRALHSQYTDKVQTYNAIISETEEVLGETNHLESEIELISRRLEHVSELLKKTQPSGGSTARAELTDQYAGGDDDGGRDEGRPTNGSISSTKAFIYDLLESHKGESEKKNTEEEN